MLKMPCDDTMIRHGPAASPCTRIAQRWTLLAAILGSSMAFMDGTVVNVALPAIQRSLRASAADAQWIVESYALFLAALLLVGGALGDRLGRRRVFVVGVSIFTVASAICAAARNADALVLARALQGIGAALLVPGSLALLSAGFEEGERGRAIGTWSAFSGVTAAIGPVVGGFLVDHLSWRWAFLLNLPLGIALVILSIAKVPESRGASAQAPLDFAGATSATLGLAGIVFALIEAPARGWGSGIVILAGAVGVAALAAFLMIEARVRDPMLPLILFRIRDFSGANLLTLLLYAALGGSLYFFPLNLIQVQGYSATAAGAALLPFIAIMFMLSRWAGSLVDRVGAKLPLVLGPAIAAAGFAAFARPGVGADYWTDFLPAVCLLGTGMAVTVAPLTTTVMNAVDPSHAGTASGVNNAVSRTASLLAIAAFGMVLAAAFDTRLDEALASLHLPAGALEAITSQRHRLAGLELSPGLPGEVAAQAKAAVGEAFVAGFRQVMWVSAGLALFSALVAWWTIGARTASASDPKP
ncbi:MFS transporter [Paucibacter sp. R3-3]|uniref:MFS transporter n=1 Tax=Roseateles agri TaxID=3098619 RepID=A0ABU5DMN6_9BURK|nr:MFS transporter [Paucibacter sp. R3-3]MDY0746322.1 MFS transporter [Paucibacter sp. R3-3]